MGGRIQRTLHKQYYPCLFDFVKKGRVANPSLILYSEVRRMTKLFDDADEFVFDDDDAEDQPFEGEEANAGDQQGSVSRQAKLWPETEPSS